MKNIFSVAVLLCCFTFFACSNENNCADTDGDYEDILENSEVETETEFEEDAAIDGDFDLEEEIEAEINELDSEDSEPEFEAETEQEIEAEADIEDPGFDSYFGSLRYTGEATGFFRTGKIGDQWWLFTPEGHPFFSTGINLLGYSGTKSIDGTYHYREAVEAKYGNEEAWAAATFERCKQWGWNTVGAWSSWRDFKDVMPYTIIIYIAHANEGPVDFFADEFRTLVKSRMDSVVKPNVDDPMLIGYFLDNEMYWTDYVLPGLGSHLFDGYMAFDYETQKGKQVLINWLELRYITFESFLEDFETEATGWEELKSVTELEFDKDDEGAQATRRAWTGKAAEAYFKITNEEFRKVDQNHLNLGVRFVSQLTPSVVLEEAGKYVDVVTINFYDMKQEWLDLFMDQGDPDILSVENFLEDHYNAAGANKPIMVTEWGYRVHAEGYNSWPPMYPTLDTQEDRADAYEEKFQKMLDKNYFVGQHWFLYADQPPEGRDNPNDGEDNTFGIVNEQDEPYTEFTERSAMMYQRIYDRLPWPTK